MDMRFATPPFLYVQDIFCCRNQLNVVIMGLDQGLEVCIIILLQEMPFVKEKQCFADSALKIIVNITASNGFLHDRTVKILITMAITLFLNFFVGKKATEWS